MIWALAGLGDEPAPFKSYTSDYTPTVAPVTPIVGTAPPGVLRMDSPPTTQQSAMAGVDSTMVIGVLAAAAVLGLMAWRGEMSPNARGRRKGRGKGRESRVMISSEHGPKKRVSQAQLRKEAKRAFWAVSAVGGKNKKMKVWPGKGGKSGHWSVSAVVNSSEIPMVASKMGQSTPWIMDVMKART